MMQIMITLMISFFISTFSSSTSSSYNIQQIREKFYEAVNDKDAAEKFYGQLKDIRSKDALLTAYYGSAQTLLAKHAWNPYRKISYLKDGLKKIDGAVIQSPESLEIRFLRFSIEHYIPPFLGYSKHIDEDKKKIVNLLMEGKLGTVDKTLAGNITSFMKKCGRLSDKEITALKG